MKLVSLELENIKSYVNEKIDFKEGINCIIGLNGSGKSTIIESIGYALFNYNKSVSDSLLRYNESKGKISVTFDSDDNYRYRIERTLRRKQAGSVKIIDLSTNEVLQENVSNVYKLVNKILKISREKTLAKLFEEIIAVPQGTFVNAFLETSVKRQANFDKLFELDIYKKLADETKKISDIVEKEYIFNLKNETSLLEGKLTDYDIKKDNINTLDNEIKSLVADKSEKQVIYNKKREEKIGLDSITAKYNELDKELINEKSHNIVLTNIFNQANENLIKSESCLDLVNKNTFGYNAFIFNNKELENNRKVLNSVNDSKKKLSNNEIKIDNNNEKIKDLEKLIHDDKVETGINLEKITNIKKEIESLDRKLKELSKEITPLRQKNIEMNKEHQRMISKISDRYNKLGNYYESIKNFDNTITVEVYDDKLKEVNLELDKINKCKEQIIALDKEKVRINSDLDNLINNEKYMNGGLCPILHEPCNNIKNGSLDCKLTDLINKDNEDIKNIIIEINNLTKQTINEEDLIRQKQSLEFNQNNCRLDREKYQNTIATIKEDFSDEINNGKEFNDINEDNALDVVMELYKKYTALQDNYENKELDESKEKEVTLNQEINNGTFQINVHKGTIKTIEDANFILSNKIKENEEKIARIKEENDGLNTINNSLKLDLVAHKNIDIDIENGENSVKKFQENYDIYIQNLEESKKVKEYSTDLENKKKDLDKSNEIIEKLNQKLLELNETFSNEQLIKLNDELTTLSNEISSIKTKVELKTIEKEKLIEIINELDIIKKEKEEKEKDIDKYNSIFEKLKMFRNIYTNLPRILSEKIRIYIGESASGIYRMISKEDVRLEIKPDYEILLIDCVDKNKIKHLDQLSGGEQMSVAISIRLAMLKHIANINVYFMDEPTVNLDKDRRMEIAEVVKDVSHTLTQLFVISHDDTFENITDSAINISKDGNISHIDN